MKIPRKVKKILFGTKRTPKALLCSRSPKDKRIVKKYWDLGILGVEEHKTIFGKAMDIVIMQKMMDQYLKGMDFSYLLEAKCTLSV